MRRADRLFGIVQRLRGGRLVTARALAERFEVSERTIYRDIADLQASGVPVDGEAGVGYLLREGFELPPLMFTRDEIVALVAGARMVQSFGGAAMARAAAEALVKIGAVLPGSERDRLHRTEIHAARDALPEAIRVTLDRLDGTMEARQVLRLGYRDENGQETVRDVRPLACGSGARCGRSSPGASCARTFACSASTGCRRSARPAAASSPSRGSCWWIFIGGTSAGGKGRRREP